MFHNTRDATRDVERTASKHVGFSHRCRRPVSRRGIVLRSNQYVVGSGRNLATQEIASRTRGGGLSASQTVRCLVAACHAGIRPYVSLPGYDA